MDRDPGTGVDVAGLPGGVELTAHFHNTRGQGLANVLAALVQLIADGRLEVPIAATYPLARVRDAYRELEQRHTLGKIVLHP